MFHIVTTIGSFFNKVHNYRMLIVKGYQLTVIQIRRAVVFNQ